MTFVASVTGSPSRVEGLKADLPAPNACRTFPNQSVTNPAICTSFGCEDAALRRYAQSASPEQQIQGDQESSRPPGRQGPDRMSDRVRRLRSGAPASCANAGRTRARSPRWARESRSKRWLTPFAQVATWFISLLERSAVRSGRDGDCVSPKRHARPLRGWWRC
jgi:hypothetical protein